MTALQGQVAVVTGAGSGIGRALARKFAECGCRLAISDINGDTLAETAAQLPDTVYTEVVDVSDRDAVVRHAATILARFGHVDIVVNNAGVDLSQTIADVGLDDFRWLMNINFWGVVYGTKAFLPGMLKRHAGTIVNISSIFGIIGWPAHGTYCASKFAIRGFTESLQHELIGTGVRAICVHPGGIDTNIVHNSRFYADQGGGRDKNAVTEEFSRLARTTPEQAASLIVRGIVRNHPRILIGSDAWAFDRIQRLWPRRYFGVVRALEWFIRRRAKRTTIASES